MVWGRDCSLQLSGITQQSSDYLRIAHPGMIYTPDEIQEVTTARTWGVYFF